MKKIIKKVAMYLAINVGNESLALGVYVPPMPEELKEYLNMNSKSVSKKQNLPKKNRK